MISAAPLCHHRELLIELAAARTGVLTRCGHFLLTVSDWGMENLKKKVSPFYHELVSTQGLWRHDSNLIEDQSKVTASTDDGWRKYQEKRVFCIWHKNRYKNDFFL